MPNALVSEITAAFKGTLVSISDVSFSYGEKPSLSNVSLAVEPGEIFALLGPNGGGKTTLFRLISTLLPLTQGEIHIAGHSVRTHAAEARRATGVTFQSPSLDGMLTVTENLSYHGRLFGIPRRELKKVSEELLERLGLADRKTQPAKELSGGLKRRLEIAKSLLSSPKLLLLDEPSTGLDPGARRDLWECLDQMRRELAMTIFLTTHLMDEAEACDRVAILHQGRVVSSGTPAALKDGLGGPFITIHAHHAEQLVQRLKARLGAATVVQNLPSAANVIRVSGPQIEQHLGLIASEFGSELESLTLSKPSLEDVFIRETGHQFWADAQQ